MKAQEAKERREADESCPLANYANAEEETQNGHAILRFDDGFLLHYCGCMGDADEVYGPFASKQEVLNFLSEHLGEKEYEEEE